ncbi:MAG: exo-alpha-sialidase [Planctomycetaceae bacterium]
MSSLAGNSGSALAAPPGLVKAEFVYETAPFPQCHASTIVQTPAGLVAAWFGGTREKHPDVGIWLSRHVNPFPGKRGAKRKWTAPTEVANGLQRNGKRFPCWNPVLFRPKSGRLLLFYKVGPSPSRWWGMLIVSKDDGKTWSKAQRLPKGILGPIKNKPIQLADGTILCPSSTEHDGWRANVERTTDDGKTWTSTGPLNDGKTFGAIQPTILRHPKGRLQFLCRSRQRVILQSWSDDAGKTWSPLAKTSLPNPNAGIDAVTLKDGRHLLVYNHTTRGRGTLNVAVSKDGKTWQAALRLENARGEFSYPAVIQTADGKVHVTYTWRRRRVKHVVIDPAKLVLRDLRGGKRSAD